MVTGECFGWNGCWFMVGMVKVGMMAAVVGSVCTFGAGSVVGRWGEFPGCEERLLLVSRDYLCCGTVRYSIRRMGMSYASNYTVDFGYTACCAGAGQGLVGVSGREAW